MDKNATEAARWLDQAEDDLAAARHNKEGGFYPQSCFLAEQASEKALKAFLYGQGERMIISHSSLDLIKKASNYHEDFLKVESQAKFLDKFYIPTRYPNGLPAGTPKDYYMEEDAGAAIKAAQDIVKLVKSCLEAVGR